MSNSISRMCCALVGLTVLLFSPTLHAQSPSGPAGAGAQRPDRADRDVQVLEKLHSTIVDANYDRVDLEDVIDDLRTRYELNIHVAWAALEASGLRRDHRVEVELSQVSLATLLDILLTDARLPGDAGFIVRNGVILIGAGEERRVDTVLRAYPIIDLIESGYGIRRFANTPVLGLELTGREFIGGEERKTTGGGGGGMGGGGGGGGGGTVFDDPAEEEPRRTEMERVEEIVNMLQENVHPESWRDYGGDIGSINVYESTLFIRHTLPVHEQIEGFFEMVRDAAPQPLDADAAVIRIRSDRAAEMREQLGEAFPLISTEAARELVSGAGEAGVLFRGTTSGFNGSRLWFSAVSQRDVMAGVNSMTGDASHAFEPVLATSTAGLELIILPLLSSDDSSFTLDVQMALIPRVHVDERVVTLAAPADGSVDVTQRTMRSVSTKVKVEADRAVVLSVPSELSDSGAAAEYEDWLIVNVRTRE